MMVLELILLAIAYTLLVIAIFLELVCYSRNIERKETIAFTLSLLLLILVLSLSPILADPEDHSEPHVLVLLCMILVSVTTLFNVWKERLHSIPDSIKRAHLGFAIILAVTTLAGEMLGNLVVVQLVVVGFLVVSIAGSMLLVRLTKAKRQFAHLEKTERIFAFAFLLLIPVYLILQFGFEAQYQKLQIGFLVPLAFILLALNKIYDDLQRLSIIRHGIEVQDQHFQNYGLTDREQEIASLLVKGDTYRRIAEQLYISLPTVKTHAGNIYRKCGVNTRHELTSLLSK